jgi:hypothetical protein
VTRIRLILMSLLAVFAVGAVASASASATVCEPLDKEGEWTWCSAAKEITSPVEGTSGVSKLESEVGGKKLTIECTADTFKGTLEDPEPSKLDGASSGEIKFTGCSVVGVAKCTVHEPIEFKFKDQLINKPPTKPEDEFKPNEGETFVEIKIEGAECAIKGTLKVKGTQKCNLDTTFETEQKEHELICTPAGSKLKLGEKEAKFTSTEKVKRVGGGVWSVRES